MILRRLLAAAAAVALATGGALADNPWPASGLNWTVSQPVGSVGLSVTFNCSTATNPCTGTSWPYVQLYDSGGAISATHGAYVQPATGAVFTVSQPTASALNATAAQGAAGSASSAWYVAPGTGATFPISAVSLPLPTNAALETGGNLATTAANTGTIAGAVTASKLQDNIAQFGGTSVVTGTGTSGAGIPRVTVSSDSFPGTQPVSGTVTANAGSGTFGTNIAQLSGSASGLTTWGTAPTSATVIGANTDCLTGCTNPDGSTFTAGTTPIATIGAQIGASAATSGKTAALAMDTGRNLFVNLAELSGTALGTPVAWGSTPSGVVLGANVDCILGCGGSLSQGSTTSGQLGSLTLGAVTATAPTYTTAQTSPLSLTTAGALRTDSSSVTQPGNTTQWASTSLGAPVAWGSAPSGNVIGANVDCVAGCSGGTASNATGVGTSSTNGQTLSFLYAFNGTTWDQLQDDGSKNLKVNVAAGAVTANAGTNLNTSSLALETGGNLATIAAAQGTSGAGTNPGTGSLGWLSGIYARLASPLTVAWSGQTVAATQSGAPWAENVTQVASTTLGAPVAWGSTPSGNVIGANVNCVVGCAGGSFNNNADAVATSATNGQTAAWLYGYNGTTWDRLRVDGSKNLDVNCAVGCAGGSVSNASSGVATSSTNNGAVSWLYAYNGATWDQLQDDSSKNLKVNLNAGTIQWGAGNTNQLLQAVVSLETTELNAAANTDYYISSVIHGTGVVANTDTSQAQIGDLIFTSGGTISPTAGANISVWFLKYDGTNYEGPCTSTTGPARAPDAVIPLPSGTSAVTTGVSYWSQGTHSVVIPAYKFKVCAADFAGVSLPSTGNTITLASPQTVY